MLLNNAVLYKPGTQPPLTGASYDSLLDDIPMQNQVAEQVRFAYQRVKSQDNPFRSRTFVSTHMADEAPEVLRLGLRDQGAIVLTENGQLHCIFENRYKYKTRLIIWHGVMCRRVLRARISQKRGAAEEYLRPNQEFRLRGSLFLPGEPQPSPTCQNLCLIWNGFRDFAFDAVTGEKYLTNYLEQSIVLPDALRSQGTRLCCLQGRQIRIDDLSAYGVNVQEVPNPVQTTVEVAEQSGPGDS